MNACSSKASSAERRYEIVKRNGNYGQICEAAREVAAAYLAQQDEPNYQRWDATAGINCRSAQDYGPSAYPAKVMTFDNGFDKPGVIH